jgi:Domain of unknown function (DUF6265)
MRRMVYAVCVVAMFSVSGHAADVSLAKLTWLAGDWQVANGTRVVEEHWTMPSANSLLGMSRTVRDGRTIAFEFVRIEQHDGDVFYVAQPGGRPPTDFKLTRSTDGELVFEGDGKDKVKRITYRRQGPNGLYALVEGEDGGKPFKSEYRYTRALGVLRQLVDSPPARPLR